MSGQTDNKDKAEIKHEVSGSKLSEQLGCGAEIPPWYGSNRFCPPECQWLSPTEAEQDRQNIKAPHRCGKYGRELVHGHQHPNIYRATCCDEP